MFRKVFIGGLLLFFTFTLATAKQIGPSNFSDVLAKNQVVIVKFWAPWCMPCSILKPEFNKAKQVLGKKAKFVEYNVDLRGKPLEKYNITLIPTMVIFKNGKEVSRDSSILDSSSIINWVSQYTK